MSQLRASFSSVDINKKGMYTIKTGDSEKDDTKTTRTRETNFCNQ
jgi:hypothetical protein